MTWIIIILVVALVLGPIMYVLPSAKDKRIMSLRTLARQTGLDVKLSSIEKLDAQAHERVNSAGERKTPSIACAAYRMAHQVEDLRELAEHRLLRLPAHPTMTSYGVFDGWAVTQADAAGWWGKDQIFWQNWLASLPLEVLAVQVDCRFVACFWRETGAPEEGVVGRIADHLEVCKKHFSS